MEEETRAFPGAPAARSASEKWNRIEVSNTNQLKITKKQQIHLNQKRALSQQPPPHRHNFTINVCPPLCTTVQVCLFVKTAQFYN